MREKLKQFQQDFDDNLSNLTSELDQMIETETQFTKAEMGLANERIDDL